MLSNLDDWWIMKKDEPHFLIIAGEASGDIHGANLVQALLDIYPKARFTGMGGARMRDAGVNTLFGIERMGTVGLVEIFSEFGHYFGVYRSLRREIASNKYTAVILIDYPTLNLRLARHSHKHDCPVYYFISPQVWAWRKGRIKSMENSIDTVITLFPFEGDVYKESKVNTCYVGHPLAYKLNGDINKKESEGENIDIALLPGSRRSEIVMLADEMIKAAKVLKEKNM